MLLGYGSDRWWRVQVIAMFAATGVIVVLGAYHYVRAPVRVEISVLDASLAPAPGLSFDLSTELAFSNAGIQPVAVSDVSLRLARHNPPRCYVIPGHSAEGAARGGLVVSSGRRERRTFRFSSAHENVSERLGVADTGSFIVEASLQVTVVDRLGRERRIPLEGLTAIVEDGALCELSFGDVVAEYVGS